MKVLCFFIVIGVCGLLGYMLEPNLRQGLTGVAPNVATPQVVQESAPSTAPLNEQKQAMEVVANTVPAAPIATPATAPSAETPKPVEETKPPVAVVTPEPAPAEMKAEEPKPEVAAPTPEVSAAPLSPDDLVKAMKDSISSGQIKEFTAEQVADWVAGADEEIEGVKYQTGLANYSTETIFGVKKVQAKALVKDGKVTKWIWPTSGLEIQ